MQARVGRPAGRATRIKGAGPAMAGAALAAGLVASTVVEAQVAEVTREITVAADGPTVVGRPQKLSSDCVHTVPEVTFLDLPAGGDVSVRPARYPLGGVVVGRVAGHDNKPDCEAIEVDGVEVVYTPRDGTAQDQLVLQMTYRPGGDRPDQVILLTLDIEVTQ